MYATGDLPQVIDHPHESRGNIRGPGTDIAVFWGCRRRTQPERQRDEALLRAVVQVSLDPPPGLIRGCDDPRPRGGKLGPALGVSDGRGDKLSEVRHAAGGAGRKRLSPRQ